MKQTLFEAAPATIRHRMKELIARLTQGAYERERVIALGLLGAMAGESVFLLGLPGVGKSMVARRLKEAFRNASAFEYLMSRFSTPDEIFGPVSISRLKDEDCYERITAGYLPSADIVFLDEIWKAGPAIQNTLLTVLNEKLFRNGEREMRLPLKGLIAASNELPAAGEGLEALWDRFLIRLVVRPIAGREAFREMIASAAPERLEIPEALRIDDAEYREYAEAARRIVVPQFVLDLLCAVHEELAERWEQAEDDEETPYVSDRRWRKAVHLLRTSALLNGRTQVDWSDCLLLSDVLWENDGQCERIGQLVCRRIVDAVFDDIRGLLVMNGDFRQQLMRQFADRPKSPDGKHYIIRCNGERLRIAIADYQSLTAESVWGRFGPDDTVVRSAAPAELRLQGGKAGGIHINGVFYPLERREEDFSVKECVAELVAGMKDRRAALRKAVDDNLFLGDYASSELAQSYKALKRKVDELQTHLLG